MILIADDSTYFGDSVGGEGGQGADDLAARAALRADDDEGAAGHCEWGGSEGVCGGGAGGASGAKGEKTMSRLVV